MIRKILMVVVALAIVGAVFLSSGFLISGRSLAATSGAGAAQPASPSVVSHALRTLLPSTRGAAQAASTATPAQATIPPGQDSESQAMEAVYAKVNPSVVKVVNMAADPNSTSNAPLPQGEGSGFVWDAQGDIVTNDHVVTGATALQVVFADGTTVKGTVVGQDPNGDIAVVKVDPGQAPLVPVTQGNLADVKVGERVLAIGNPFGFSGTMTQGIVSAMGRTIPALTQFSIPGAIQTDAAINPGNSGGPLLTLQGQVIGVNDQIQSASGSNSGVGFAIPIGEVQRIVPALIRTGKYSHPYLGIQGATYSSTWAQALGFPANARGVYISDVLAGGPAARAGVRPGTQDTSVVVGVDNFGQPVDLQAGGDLITAVDGHKIQSVDDLLNYLEDATSAGQKVQVSVLRSGGRQQTIPVTLGAKPEQQPQQQNG